MRHFAVVGSGPAGFYTAEAVEKAYGGQARIDIIDRYPVPYGLIRFGVALVLVSRAICVVVKNDRDLRQPAKRVHIRAVQSLRQFHRHHH